LQAEFGAARVRGQAFARFASPLGVYDFQKRTSLIEVSAVGAQTLGRIASTLAHGEGLTAHARSAEFRLQD
jgi:histidinol dehydrogenase